MIRTRTTASAGVLAATVLLSGCLGDGGTTEPSNPPNVTGPFLVFVSDRAGAEDLYRVETDGTGLQQLTGFPGVDLEPDCSPDGERIAFESVGRREDTNASDVFTLDRTPNIRRITLRDGQDEFDYSPAWNPDATRMAFITSGRSQFGGAQDRLATMADDGTVIEGVGADVRAVSVDWSFDGHGLAISTDEGGDGDLDLVRLDSDGGNAQTLAADPVMDEIDPAWEGGGDRVVFARLDPGTGAADLWVVGADGTGLARLTDHQARDVQPSWSPDGSKIAFASDRSGNWDVYVMNPDGSGVQRVTEGSSRDEMPDWCPRPR